LTTKTIAALEEEIKKVREQEKCRKREKRYIEASKKVMFLIILLVFIVFFTCLYIAIRTYSTDLSIATLQQAVLFSAPVLTALIVKSGFENVRKGKIREKIIDSKINNNESIEYGAEDFRESV
jgi:cell division protein FtsL